MPLPFQANINDQLYKYTLNQYIGGGQFGEVWLVHDQTIQQNLAVKFLDGSKAAISDLLREAVVGNRAGHCNLVKVHSADVFNHNGFNLVSVAMDYHPNGSIDHQQCSGDFIPIEGAVSQIQGVLRGLDYLHGQNTVHNDIKPQNILIGDHGEGILTDYGISAVTANGKAAVAPNTYLPHIAPEVIQNGKIDVLTDIYQLGLTLFRVTNGLETIGSKFQSMTPTDYHNLVLSGNLIHKNDYLPFVPTSLKKIINTATKTNPADRYQSAHDMRRALERINYYGSWVVTAIGEYAGEDTNNNYRFEIDKTRNGHFKITTFKKNKRSHKETRVGAYSQTGLTQKEALKMRNAFMVKMVEGKI